MKIEDVLKLSHAWRYTTSDFLVERVEIVGLDSGDYHKSDMIIRRANGSLQKESGYRLHATETDAKSACRDEIKSTLGWYRTKVETMESVLKTLVEPDADDITSEFPTPLVGVEAVEVVA